MALVPASSKSLGLPLALAGATAATRYVGATVSGAPASGTFAVGDFTIDQSGAAFVCTVAGTPGTWAQAGSTYTAPTTREQVAGNNVNIANNAVGVLTWDTKSSGTSLLDLTTPAAPAIVTAGVYAVAVEVSPGGNLTAAGSYDGSLELDQGGDDALVSATSPAAKAGSLTPNLALAMTYYIPALGTIKVSVVNRDGVNAVNYSLFGIVQRLS